MVVIDSVLLRSDPVLTGRRPWGEEKGLPAGLKDRHSGEAGGHLAEVFKSRVFWLIGLSYFSISYALYAVTTFMVDYAKYQLGFPIEKASYLATVHGMCQVIGVLGILPVSDYLGRKKTIVLSNAAVAAAIMGIIMAGDSLVMLYVSVGIMAVFYGVTFPIYGACAGDYFHRNVMATVIGAWTPFYGCGAICSHWVSGILRDTRGVYDQAFLIGVGMALVGVIFIGIVKRPK
jgi:MFS family permease